MKKQIVVEIEVMDAEHCSDDCDFLQINPITKKLYCYFGGLRVLKDVTGHIRTAECKKRELTCSENKSVQQK